MNGGDAAHTGEQQTPVIGPSDQWEYQVNGELMCPPSTGYGKLFIGTSDGNLKVLDEVDGSELWRIKLGESICASPLVESQTAFVPVGNTLYAVAIQDRSVRWSFEAVGALRGSPVLFDNLVYIGSEDKHVYALDKYDGTPAWSLKLDDVVATSPSVSGLTVIVGTESGTVFGIHRNEGGELWRTDLGSPVSTAASISRGTAMIGTYGGRLHGLDMEDGNPLWTYPERGQPVLDPILEAYVEKDRTPEEIAALGFDPDLVSRVIAMVDLNEYKRRQAPPGVKITPKAFGKDRRLPVTNRYKPS